MEIMLENDHMSGRIRSRIRSYLVRQRITLMCALLPCLPLWLYCDKFIRIIML